MCIHMRRHGVGGRTVSDRLSSLKGMAWFSMAALPASGELVRCLWVRGVVNHHRIYHSAPRRFFAWPLTFTLPLRAFESHYHTISFILAGW